MKLLAKAFFLLPREFYLTWQLINKSGYRSSNEDISLDLIFKLLWPLAFVPVALSENFDIRTN